jgi:tRNA-dihydrouridine synthase B
VTTPLAPAFLENSTHPAIAAPFALPHLSIGSISIESPFVQAALSGYSDWAMRVMARRCGAAYSVCEVMLDRFVREVKGTGRTRHHLMVTDEEHPVGAQLMGADPADFGPAAIRLVDAGFDVIDINFGCPVKKVLGRCRGGYHLSQPSVAVEIIHRVRDAVPTAVPVTVKLRSGIDGSEESRDRFFAILTAAFETGVAAATVHGRTVEQRYIGPSNSTFLREVKEQFPDRTIIGSGDLFSADACLRMLAETGVDGVSIARGAIGNPWIFQQARALSRDGILPRPPSVHEQARVLHEHFELAAHACGAERALTTMRKFAIKYARSHPRHVQVRNAFAAAKNVDQWRAVLGNWYTGDAPGCYPLVDEVSPTSAP